LFAHRHRRHDILIGIRPKHHRHSLPMVRAVVARRCIESSDASPSIYLPRVTGALRGNANHRTPAPPPLNNTVPPSSATSPLARCFGEPHRPTFCPAGAALITGARVVDLAKGKPPQSLHWPCHRTNIGRGDRPRACARLTDWRGLAKALWAVGPKLAQYCSPLFHFIFRFKISRKCCKLLKYI
jgi:hypothetical protein